MLQKCPRCELNYITEGEKYCKICRMEMKGESLAAEPDLCSVCGERPCMVGKDICLYCYKEMSSGASGGDSQDEMNAGEEPNIGIDPISGMDEIIPDDDASEDEISLEAMEEEEEEEEEEDTDNEDEIYRKQKR